MHHRTITVSARGRQLHEEASLMESDSCLVQTGPWVLEDSGSGLAVMLYYNVYIYIYIYIYIYMSYYII